MRYELEQGLWICPTPAGAYRAVSQATPDIVARFLLGLLSRDQAMPLAVSHLVELSGQPEQEALTLLHRMQEMGWVEGFPDAHAAPEGALDRLVPELLPNLSSSRRAMLADSQGFYVATTGFPHETAEELAALSAAIGALHERNSGLLQGNLRLGTSAWAVVDAAGNSRVGFWPLHVGGVRFVLTLGDMPRLHHPDMLRLVWALQLRYGMAGAQ